MNNNMDKAKLFTAKELASYLNCNVQTVYRYADKGIIKSVKCGSLRRFEMPGKGQNNETRGQNSQIP